MVNSYLVRSNIVMFDVNVIVCDVRSRCPLSSDFVPPFSYSDFVPSQ